MSLQMFFPHLRGFRLLSFQREADRVVLTCERVPRTARCPVCGSLAQRIHSRYQRTVWDLPLQKTQVFLRLHVRKFYCDQPDCSRRIFAERLPQVTTPHGRFTIALRQMLGHLGREHGGAPGARSASQLGIQVTPRAILRDLARLAPACLRFSAHHRARRLGVETPRALWGHRRRFGARSSYRLIA